MSYRRSLEVEDAAPSGWGSSGAACQDYEIYGVRVRSEVALPVEPLERLPGLTPRWTFRLAHPLEPPLPPDGPRTGEARCEHGSIVSTVHRGPGGAWFWSRQIGICHVLPDAQTVKVYPASEADQRRLGLLLVGQVAVFLLHQSGQPSLHASAVVTEGRTIVFLGPKGSGKSTLAAAFLRRGASLLTDDVLPIEVRGDEILGLPSVPIMKLWPDTAREALQLVEKLPSLADHSEKTLLALAGRYEFAAAPARLGALYLLHRYDSDPESEARCSIRPVTGQQALAALLSQTSNRAALLPAELAKLLPIYARLCAQAPLYELRYPSSFEQHHRVCDQIQASLEAA